MKTVASLALLGLAYTFEDNEFAVGLGGRLSRPLPTNLPLPSFEDTDNELSLVGFAGFSQRNHHTIGKSMPRRAQLDDEDNELYNMPHIEVQHRHPAIKTPIQKTVHHDDDEFYSLPPIEVQKIVEPLKTTQSTNPDESELYQMPKLERQIAAGQPIKGRNTAQINSLEENEFFNQELLEINDKEIETKPENFKNLVRNVLEVIKEIAEADDISDHIFCGKRGNPVSDLAHHVTVWSHYDHYDHYDHFDDDDDFLVSLGNLIQDGLNIYNDAKNKDYGNLVDHGVQTVKDVKGKKKFLGF